MSILDKFRDHRENADDDIVQFLSGAKNYNIIFFDTETNGFVGNPMPSVLSISAIKAEIQKKDWCPMKGLYNRCYYSRENYNPNAIKVNGLTEEVVTEKRKHHFETQPEYPKYFDEDYDALMEFFSDTDLFVGHNAVDFDCKFLPFYDWKNVKVFDTMKSNRDICCVEWKSDINQWKNPKLIEAAAFYKVETTAEDLHGSLYDAKIAAKIFLTMLEKSTVRLRKF